MDNKVKKMLLNLLTEDEEVINAVKRIYSSENKISNSAENKEQELLERIKKLEGEVSLVAQQKDMIQKAFYEQKVELEKKQSELLELAKAKEDQLREKDASIELIKIKYAECKNEKDDAIEKYNDFKLKYSEFDAVYNKYLGLGAPVMRRMERILNRSAEASETPEIFMAYGTQENNIVALWESIATNYDFYDSYGKTQDLIDIFQYFLVLYKEITYKNIMIDWPNPGDPYDERFHTRTSSSNAVGKIQKVILPGFAIGKNIMKKSLVIVK